MAIGAAADYRGVGWFCPGLEQPDGGGSFTLGFRSGLMVDADGNRYANECLPYDRFGREMAKAARRGSRPGSSSTPARAVGCRRSRCPRATRPSTSPPAPGCRPTRSRSWPALIGVPADALVASVERFNGFCETGVDEDFGRGEDEYDTFFAGGTGPNKALTPCDQPPYLAARFVLSDLGTKGGLVTDAAGRVLREDGSAIAGLYASSNSAASVFGGGLPRPGRPARLGDGVRVARRAGPGRLTLG